jgi:NOL1/NOP2/sun family putative RNA methylase
MLPPQFLSRMQNLLGAEYADFLACYDQPSDVGIRVNTLKLGVENFQAISPFQLTPIPWVPAGFRLLPGQRPGKHPYHTAGLYYVQDPAAMAVGELLDPQPGERILDLAAAPGGKASHIAALMQGEGLLVANDLNLRRAQVMARNLERWGAHNVIILNENPDHLANHFGAYFDRVLVDAPCSGEGMFRKDPATSKEWQPDDVMKYAARQDILMAQAARLVRPGGTLVYATCTFAPEEDEGTLTRFLDQHNDFELASPPVFAGFSSGHPEWIETSPPDLTKTVRLWPHTAPGEGHFIAVLRKSDGFADSVVAHPLLNSDPMPPEYAPYFQEFCERSLNWHPEEVRLALKGAYLYQLPANGPDLRGLKVVHWGWWLGTMKKKRFEPSHALAMGLEKQDFIQTLDLPLGSREVEAYLRGDVLSSAGDNAWVVITLDGFPLGWGKRVQDRLKTHLPKWLRQF